MLFYILSGYCVNNTFAENYLDYKNEIKVLLNDDKGDTEQTSDNHKFLDAFINCLGATIGGVITAVAAPLITARIQAKIKEKEEAKNKIKTLIVDFLDKLRKQDADVIGYAENFCETITSDSSIEKERRIWDARIMPRYKLTKLSQNIQDELNSLDKKKKTKDQVGRELVELLDNYLGKVK